MNTTLGRALAVAAGEEPACPEWTPATVAAAASARARARRRISRQSPRGLARGLRAALGASAAFEPFQHPVELGARAPRQAAVGVVQLVGVARKVVVLAVAVHVFDVDGL